MTKCPNCGQRTEGDACPWCGYPLVKRGWFFHNEKNHLRKLIKRGAKRKSIVKEARKAISREAREESARMMTEQLLKEIRQQAKKEAVENVQREAQRIIGEVVPRPWSAPATQMPPPVVPPPAHTGPAPPLPPHKGAFDIPRTGVPQPPAPSTRTRVFVVDRQMIFHEGVRLYLAQTSDLELAGRSSDFTEATVAAVRDSGASVVLVDVNPPLLNGFDLAGLIGERLPGLRVVMLSAFEMDEQILQALKVGAAGFLGKDVTPEEIVAVIRTVAAGERVTDRLLARPRIAQRVLAELRPLPRESPASLTTEESEALHYFAHGYSTKQVARALAASEEAVASLLVSVAGKVAGRG